MISTLVDPMKRNDSFVIVYELSWIELYTEIILQILLSPFTLDCEPVQLNVLLTWTVKV